MPGPYVITTTTPEGDSPCPECGLVGEMYRHDAGDPWSCGGCDCDLQPSVSRLAVATLDEAEMENAPWAPLRTRLDTVQWYLLLTRLADLPSAGGSVDMDGTTITVEAVTDDELYALAGKPAITYKHPVQRSAAILAAFNAAQETSA